MTPKDVLKLAKENKALMVDFKFMDFPGLWQHTTCPISELTLASFDPGFGFDGSSLLGWQAITSGMNVVSAHVIVADGADPAVTLDALCACLSDDFDIEHSTFQLETADRRRVEEAGHA